MDLEQAFNTIGYNAVSYYMGTREEHNIFNNAFLFIRDNINNPEVSISLAIENINILDNALASIKTDFKTHELMASAIRFLSSEIMAKKKVDVDTSTSKG